MKRVKTSQYLILTVIVIVIIVPLVRLYTVNPNVNACMIEYVDNLNVYKPSGYLYKVDWVNHIETKESIFNKYIFEHKVWYSEGCIMASGRLFTDFNNSVYCSFVYMAKTWLDKYSRFPHLSLLERFELYKAQERYFAETLKSDLLVMEDMLFYYIQSTKWDVLFSLKYLTNNTLDGIKNLFS